VYLAAALSLPGSWRGRLWATLGALPMIVLLAMARLFALALPPAMMDSPLPLVHGFNQLLVGVLAVVAMAVYREGFAAGSRSRVVCRMLWASGAGLLLASALGAVYTHGLLWLAGAARAVAAHTLTRVSWPQDEQGALWLLPAYQIGLLAAVWIAAGLGRPRRFAIALSVLALSHLVLLMAWGEAAAHFGRVPHALVVRAWAVAGPLLAAWLFGRDGSCRTVPGRMAPGPAGLEAAG
jgi:hypothetical protein